jgi:formylglycine-generating enzyme required for sulfatase activity
VSLLDAMAYCGFLTAGDPGEVRYRLPTKSEWERAARGVDGRPFPWGTDPLLPLREGVAGLGTTVDSHPSLRSPFGHLHMGSGVSEWSLTREGKLRYCVMGRSFDLPADRIHVGYAVGESPIVRSASTGFRVLQEPAK